MVLGQALMAGSMVQGAKLRVWVKLRLARVWSEEKNYGLGSNDGGGKCGPGRETAVLGQALPRPSVVRGEKLWSLVKRWWREVWSREQNRAPGSSPAEVWSRELNCGPGSSPALPECGPRREIMVLGQALVAGSMVQGAKPCPWVKPVPARVWSEERNYGLWSNAGGGKYGLGRETAVLGQALVAGSVV